MTHVITGLCLRDDNCSTVCPVECIQPGTPNGQWPTYYIDPGTCIDCGACVPECPYHAIYPLDEVPASFQAVGGEVLNQPGLSGQYQGVDHNGNAVSLGTTRVLAAGVMVDLTYSIKENAAYFK